MTARTFTMGTHLEPGTFNFITPTQHEPITTHRKKATKFRHDHSPTVKIVSPARPPVGEIRPVMNVPPEVLVEIMAYGSQKDKLAWMLVGRKFVDPAERALWRTCGRSGFLKLSRMSDEGRDRLVKMIKHLQIGDDPLSLSLGSWRHRSYTVQRGVYPNPIPMVPASWLTHHRLRSFMALTGSVRNSAIDDVLTALEQASALEVFQIDHHIERNTADVLPQLLDCLPRLRIFEARYVGSGNLLPHLAMLSALESVSLGGTLDHETVNRALEKPDAFKKLQTLEIAPVVDVAADLLQHLPRLKELKIAFKRNLTLSDQDRENATTSNLQAIGALSTLSLLNLNFASFNLANELKPLEQLSSLRKLKLVVQPHHESHVPRGYVTKDVIEALRFLPLEEFRTNRSFRNEELISFGRACPRLRFLHFCHWDDLDSFDASLPPMFLALEHLQIDWLFLDGNIRFRYTTTLGSHD